MNKDDGAIFVGEKTGENRKARQMANEQKEPPGQTTNGWEGLLLTIAERAILVCNTTAMNRVLPTPQPEMFLEEDGREQKGMTNSQ